MEDDLYIAGDWGTTRLRLSLCAGRQVLDSRAGPGIGALNDSAECTVRALIEPWIATHGPLQIVLCGMAGSRNGWVETGYVACPSDIDDWRAGLVRFDAGGRRLCPRPRAPGFPGCAAGSCRDSLR
jgi:2-dehydro-3-deoxygalactonokinase